MKRAYESMSDRRQVPLVSLGKFMAAAILLAVPCSLVSAQTGTFVDRWAPSDLRVVSYNIWLDSIFVDDNNGPTEAPKFVRVMQALQPDIINLQEIYDHTAAETVSLMNSILPLDGGASWYAHQSYDNILVSKYPLTMTAEVTVPVPSTTSYAMALVNLPDDLFDHDFYFMNSHFKCCGSTGSTEDIKRQQQADALANWMRDARTPGGFVNLPPQTPMAVVGDFNIVGSQQPLNTLITGNIINEGTYGTDSPPDWDGTSLVDAHPVHNGSGTTDYTYRSGSFSPSRLDYVLYTDSVADVANKFVLNPLAMTVADRNATGLQPYDVSTGTSTTNFDHLPLIVDFRFAESIPGDFDDSGYVDDADFSKWRMQFGMSVDVGSESDGNSNGLVDAADYSIWRDNLGAGTPSEGAGFATAIPEPGSAILWLSCFCMALLGRKRRN